MKTYNLILLFCIITLDSVFCQLRQSETEYLDSIIRLEYPKNVKEYNVVRLDTITDQSIDYIRLWTNRQIITLSRTSAQSCSGSLVNHILKCKTDKSKSNYEECFIVKSFQVVDSTDLCVVFDNILNLGVLYYPTESLIEGWKWIAMDSETYTFECLINGEYQIKTYNSPESLNDSIKYKNEILNVTKYFESQFDLKVRYDNFVGALPKGTYKDGYTIILKEK